MLSPDRQRFMAERMKARLHSYPTDHTPIVTAPWAVLAVLREAIES